jgi:hypothetical protein
MDKPLGTFRGLLIGITVLAAALYAVSVLPGVAGVEHLAAYLRTVWEHERLVQDQAVLSRTAALRKDIVARLSQGHLSLQEASDALREELESRPRHLQPGYPPHVLGVEQYTWTVLAWVKEDLRDDPRRDEIRRRLLAELPANSAARNHPIMADVPDGPEAATSTP